MCLCEETLFEEDAHLLVEGGICLSGANEGGWNVFAREGDQRCVGEEGVRRLQSNHTAQPASEIGVWLMIFISLTEDDLTSLILAIK